MWREVTFATSFFLAVLLLCLAGCDTTKWFPNSPTKVRTPAKERRPGRPTQEGSRAQLAIILDDVASDPAAVQAIFSLHYPLTLSILPNHAHSKEIAEEAHQRGYQVMLHLPMQSVGNEIAEAQQLRGGMNTAEISKNVSEMLERVPHAAGVNNHQGSLATSDPVLMSELMGILRERRLFFIDSRTTTATVAFQEAEKAGVRCAFRNEPFLDDVQNVSAIRHQLMLAIRGAAEKGDAIAIGHPHPETLQALREILPQAQAQGVRLVYVSDLVQ
jgi:uncharacterized protein